MSLWDENLRAAHLVQNRDTIDLTDDSLGCLPLDDAESTTDHPMDEFALKSSIFS